VSDLRILRASKFSKKKHRLTLNALNDLFSAFSGKMYAFSIQIIALQKVIHSMLQQGSCLPFVIYLIFLLTLRMYYTLEIPLCITLLFFLSIRVFKNPPILFIRVSIRIFFLQYWNIFLNYEYFFKIFEYEIFEYSRLRIIRVSIRILFELFVSTLLHTIFRKDLKLKAYKSKKNCKM
jgi:hypothetical protein